MLKSKGIIVVLSCLVSVSMILALSLPMTVQAASNPGIISDYRQYTYWYFDDTLGNGAVTLNVPWYLTNVPISSEFEFVENIGGTFDYYHSQFSCDWSYDYLLTLLLPTNFQYKVINGTFTVELVEDISNTFYAGLNNIVQDSWFSDFTQRMDVSLGDIDLQGVSATLVQSSVVNQANQKYRLNLNFTNYYVPKARDNLNNYVAAIGIPLHLNYTFNGQKLVDNVSVGSDVLQLTALTQTVKFYPYGETLNGQNMMFEPAHFVRDNDYYTFLRALDDSDIAIDVEALTTMLAEWTQFSAGTVPIDFPTFANQVLSALGSSGTTNSQQMQVIFGYLAQLVASQGNLESYLYDIYTMVTQSGFDPDGYPYENLAGYIAAIYVSLCGPWVPAEDNNAYDISNLSYNRWVQIIKDAIEDQLSMENVAGSAAAAEYETNAASADVLVGDVENMENDLWSDVDRYVANIGTVSDMSAPVASVPAAVWFVSAVENVWSRMGIFSFVITVSLFGGILVILLGRIGGMFRGDPPQKNS